MTDGAIASLPSDVPAIALRQLSKSYGALQAVRNVSLEVEQGELTPIAGRVFDAADPWQARGAHQMPSWVKR